MVEGQANSASSEYATVGVDYDVLDEAKRAAVAAAATTSGLLALVGGAALDESRGEPAFVFRLGDLTLGLVIEGVGTKSLICRAYEDATGVDLWAGQGHDAVAMVVNDLICVGALPLVVNAYFATGSAEWFGDGHRVVSLARGWREACEISGAVWGGGESPTLPGLLTPGEIDLAGCAVGQVPDGVDPILGADLAAGDRIIFLDSSGLHANGASLARRVIAELPDGVVTKLPSGATLGEALLEPTANYVPIARALLEARLPVTYLSAITGHGLRKVMRPQRDDLRYRVSALPEVPEVLEFLVGHLGLSDQDAYGTFNMGAGFAVYVRPEAAADTIALATRHGFTALDAGVVEAGSRSVVVEPIGATYSTDELRLR